MGKCYASWKGLLHDWSFKVINAKNEEWEKWTKEALEWEVGEDSSSEMTFQLKSERTWRNKQTNKKKQVVLRQERVWGIPGTMVRWRWTSEGQISRSAAARSYEGIFVIEVPSSQMILAVSRWHIIIQAQEAEEGQSGLQSQCHDY